MTDLYYYLIYKIIVRLAKKVSRKTKLKIVGETVVLQHKQKKTAWQVYSRWKKKGIFFLQTIWNFPNFDDEKPVWPDSDGTNWGKPKLSCLPPAMNCVMRKRNPLLRSYSRWQRGGWLWIIGGMIITGQDRRSRRKTCHCAHHKSNTD